MFHFPFSLAGKTVFAEFVSNCRIEFETDKDMHDTGKLPVPQRLEKTILLKHC